MGFNFFKIVGSLNDLNCYLLYFPKENPNQLNQDKIIEILDQAKTWDSEWYESMIKAHIDILNFLWEISFLLPTFT
jgi:hypothetical protein